MRSSIAFVRMIFVASVLLLASGSSHAFYDSLTIIPSNPTTVDRIQLSIRSGGPDNVSITGPTDRIVQIIGQRLIVTFRATSNPGNAATFPTATTLIDLIPLPPGTYRLEVNRQFAGTIFSPELVGILDFGVGQAPAQPVPALSASGIAVLVGLLLGGCFVWTRRVMQS